MPAQIVARTDQDQQAMQHAFRQLKRDTVFWFAVPLLAPILVVAGGMTLGIVFSSLIIGAIALLLLAGLVGMLVMLCMIIAPKMKQALVQTDKQVVTGIFHGYDHETRTLLLKDPETIHHISLRYWAPHLNIHAVNRLFSEDQLITVERDPVYGVVFDVR